MITTLALAFLASTAPSPTARPDNPPVQVWLNSENSFANGDRVRVYVRAENDGYLVVLHADGQGHVQVLFPQDPGIDGFVRGDRKFEVRSRGDHEAFVIDEQEGTGYVLVAWAPSEYAFDFHDFVQGDRWDSAALDERQQGSEGEQVLLDIVQRMVGEGHFEYDLATYAVPSATAYDNGPSDNPGYVDGYGHPGVGVSVAIGSPWWTIGVGYGPYCNYWYAWGCGAGYWPYYAPAYYRYRPYRYYTPYVYGRPYYYNGYRPYGYTYSRPYRFGSPTSPFPNARPRVRTPESNFSARRADASGRTWSERGLRPAPSGRTFSAPSNRGSTAAPVRRSFGGSAERSSRGSPRASAPAPRGGGGGGRASVGRSSGGGGGGERAGGGGGGGRRR